MNFTRNEILTHQKRNSVYITSRCRWNEVKILFGGGTRKTTHSVKANHFYFYEINAFADVSCRLISFRVMFKYLITRNEVSFLSK